MEKIGLGKRINLVRKGRNLTADRLSEICNINATYLRQIESGLKQPSLPVFISLCNALEISPDYLLRDELTVNEVSEINVLNELWTKATPSQQQVATSMLEAFFRRDCN